MAGPTCKVGISLYILQQWKGLKVRTLGLGSRLGCHWLRLGAQVPKRSVQNSGLDPDQGGWRKTGTWRTASSAHPWEAFLRKKYLTEVVCTTDGDTLKVFNFIQINMGAGARPILAIWTIWRPQRGTCSACLLNKSCLYYWKGHPEGVQLHPDHHGGRRQSDLGYLDHLEAPENHLLYRFTK